MHTAGVPAWAARGGVRRRPCRRGGVDPKATRVLITRSSSVQDGQHEELDVLGVGPRRAALDVVHAEGVGLGRCAACPRPWR